MSLVAVMSVGSHHFAWELRTLVWNIVGVFIISVALAACTIKRAKKDDSTAGVTAVHRQGPWKETADEHWAQIQAHSEYRVVPHTPTYVNAPAAGRITRVGICTPLSWHTCLLAYKILPEKTAALQIGFRLS